MLQYPDLLPVGKEIYVAMDVILDKKSGYLMFNLAHESNGRWLDARICCNSPWSSDTYFAFVRRS